MTGEAEWAAIQTVQLPGSIELECWCVAKAYADHNVSIKQNQAMRFELNRMQACPH